MESWNPRMACVAWPKVPEKRKKTPDPYQRCTWRETPALPQSFQPSKPGQGCGQSFWTFPQSLAESREGAGEGRQSWGGKRRTSPGNAGCHLGSVSVPLLGHSSVPRAPQVLTPTQTDTGGLVGGLWGCSVLCLSPPTSQDCGRWLSPVGDPTLVTKVHAWLCCSSSCAHISWV